MNRAIGEGDRSRATSLPAAPRRRVVRLTVGVLAGAWLAAAAAAQETTVAIGPSSRKPDAALAVYPDPALEKARDQAQTVWLRAAALLSEHNVTAAPQEQIETLNQAQVAGYQLHRLVLQLNEAREPAGVDFELRLTPWRGEVRKRINDLRARPEVLKALQKNLRVFVNDARKREKVIPQADRLARQGQWEEAAEMLFEVVDELNAQCIWYEPAVGDQLLRAYVQPVQIVTEKLKALRREQRTQLLTQASQPKPDPALFLLNFKASIESVRATGAAELDKQLRTGPELLALLAERRGTLAAQVLRQQGLSWYLHGKSDEKLNSELVALQGELPTLASALIQAEAERISPDQARGFYQAYLAAAIPLAAGEPNPELEGGLRQALDALAERDPALRQELVAFRAATGGVLKWRRRVADAAVRFRQLQFPLAAKRFAEGLHGEDPFQGLFGSEAKTLSLNDPASAVIQVAQDRLRGQRVQVTLVAPQTELGSQAASIYSGGCYAVMPQPRLPDWMIQGLRAELLLANGEAPPTLEAGVVLFQAEHGAFDSVGGEITGVELEPLLPRCAAALPARGGLARPGLTIDFVEPPRQVLMQLAFEPKWLKSRCLFVEFPVRATAGR